MSDADGSPATPQSAMPQDAPQPTGLPPNDAPAGAAPSSTPPPSGPPAPERENVIDAIADLLQMLVNWLRQEAAGIMRDKVVLPGQQLGMLVAFAMAAAALMVIGLGFLFVAFLMVLASYIGWPAALAVVGTAILIGAGVLTYLKMRSIQT